MRTDIRDQWVTALTDGSYQQGYSVLTSYDVKVDTSDDGTVTETTVRKDCCLGVLCDLAVKAGALTALEVTRDDTAGTDVTVYADSHGRQYTSYLPWAVVEWAGLEGRTWTDEDAANMQSQSISHPEWLEGTDIAVRAGEQSATVGGDYTGQVREATLAGMNDNGKTFAEIADVVRTF